jgi:pterin-4a-carbinolamine dehydratase
LLDELDDRWQVEDERILEATIRFDDFVSAMSFANEVGELAEAVAQRPCIRGRERDCARSTR